MFSLSSLLRGKRSVSRAARHTTAPPRRFWPVVEQLEDRLAPAGSNVTVAISPPNPTVAVGMVLPFQATESDRMTVTSQVQWSVLNLSGTGFIQTSGLTPGLFVGVSAGTVIVQAVDPLLLLRAQTQVTVIPAPADTSVAVASDDAAPVFGQNVTFTATVSSQSPGQGTPTGFVDFVIDGATVTGPVPLNASAQASFQTNTLNVANSPHSIAVNYVNGDGNFNNSSGSLAGGQIVSPANTSVLVASDNAAPVHGHNVTFTATVSTQSPGQGTPTGFVQFVIDGSPVTGGVPLNASAQASFQTNTLNVANSPHSIAVNYVDGDGNFNNSSGLLAGGQAVFVGTETGVETSDSDPVVGTSIVTFRAYVIPTTDAIDPTGTLTFYVDGIPRATRTLNYSLNAYVTPFTTTFPTLGIHTIQATYGGDGRCAGSTATVTVSVYPETQAFLVHVYHDLLQRDPTPGELASGSTALESGLTRSGFALQIERSSQYRAIEVDAAYLHILRRQPDPTELAAFVGFLQSGGTVEEMDAQLYGSPEYFFDQGGSVDYFLFHLFRDAFQYQLPTQGELDSLSKQLYHSVSRQQVAANLLGSHEYKEDLARGFYSEFLKVRPDAGTLGPLAGQLAAGVTDEVVIAEILGSSQYLQNL